jgi:aldehyde dehydrogenase (NAD+)
MSDLLEFKNLINGELRPAASGRLLDSINPTTGAVWAKVPASDQTDANAAVAAAAAAFREWSALPASARATYLQKVAGLFTEHGEELARLETTDNGNLLGITRRMNGVGMATLWGRVANETLAAVTGRSVVLDPRTHGLTRRDLRVVAAIVPFNMPIGVRQQGRERAAAGNTQVAKPPEQASAGILRR